MLEPGQSWEINGDESASWSPLSVPASLNAICPSLPACPPSAWGALLGNLWVSAPPSTFPGCSRHPLTPCCFCSSAWCSAPPALPHRHSFQDHVAAWVGSASWGLAQGRLRRWVRSYWVRSHWVQSHWVRERKHERVCDCDADVHWLMMGTGDPLEAPGSSSGRRAPWGLRRPLACLSPSASP